MGQQKESMETSEYGQIHTPIRATPPSGPLNTHVYASWHQTLSHYPKIPMSLPYGGDPFPSRVHAAPCRLSLHCIHVTRRFPACLFLPFQHMYLNNYQERSHERIDV